MLDIVAQCFLASLPIYFFFALGFWLRHRRKIQEKHEEPIVMLVMDLAYPCLIFYNIISNARDSSGVLSDPLFCIQAASCGFMEMLIGVSCAYLLARLLHLRIGQGLRSFVVSAGLQNYVFFAIPLLYVLSLGPDDPSMGVLFVHNVGCDLFVWTLAVFLMSGKRADLQFRALLRAPMLAVLISLLIVWLGLNTWVDQPFIMNSAQMLGAVATPISLILCGCSIYDISRKGAWNRSLMGAGVAVRLILAPLFILLMAWVLPVDPLIKRMIVVQSAIPSAVTTLMLARRFGGDPELSMQVILITTLCCLLTLPLWLLLGDAFIVPLFPSHASF